MKPYRVTMTIIIDNRSTTLSAVIPAYNHKHAVKKCREANGLGEDVDGKAELINS
jgi:hypothetical protein